MRFESAFLLLDAIAAIVAGSVLATFGLFSSSLLLAIRGEEHALARINLLLIVLIELLHIQHGRIKAERRIVTMIQQILLALLQSMDK